MDRRGLLQRLLASVLVSPHAMGGMAAHAAGNPVRRRLRFTLTFSNPLARPLENQRFWCYLPAEMSGMQRLVDVQVSVPHRRHEDALGHRILELNFDELPPLARKIVTVRVEAELYGPSLSTTLLNSADWIQSERFIESDDPRMRARASELRREQPLATARAIYDWVRAHVGYAGYVAEDFGALYALLEGIGDCTEFANLVVALARADGLPARMVGGYVVDRDSAPRPEEYHNWAEIYIDGAWRLVDAQKENWLVPTDRYVAFRYYRDAALNPVGFAHRYRIQGEMEVAF